MVQKTLISFKSNVNIIVIRLKLIHYRPQHSICLKYSLFLMNPHIPSSIICFQVKNEKTLCRNTFRSENVLNDAKLFLKDASPHLVCERILYDVDNFVTQIPQSGFLLSVIHKSWNSWSKFHLRRIKAYLHFQGWLKNNKDILKSSSPHWNC